MITRIVVVLLGIGLGAVLFLDLTQPADAVQGHRTPLECVDWAEFTLDVNGQIDTAGYTLAELDERFEDYLRCTVNPELRKDSHWITPDGRATWYRDDTSLCLAMAPCDTFGAYGSL